MVRVVVNNVRVSVCVHVQEAGLRGEEVRRKKVYVCLNNQLTFYLSCLFIPVHLYHLILKLGIHHPPYSFQVMHRFVQPPSFRFILTASTQSVLPRTQTLYETVYYVQLHVLCILLGTLHKTIAPVTV